jgi:hypothetical protein
MPTVIPDFVRALASHDCNDALAFLADGATYDMRCCSSLMGYGGIYQGRPEVRLLLRHRYEVWEIVEWRPRPLVVHSAGPGAIEAAVCVDMRLVHMETGYELDDWRRFVVTEVDGRIASCVESLDEPRPAAFLAWAEWSAAEDRSAAAAEQGIEQVVQR